MNYVQVGVAMAKSGRTSVKRRDFLKKAAVGAAALAATPRLTEAQPPRGALGCPVAPISPETEFGTPPAMEVLTVDRTGSDFMVDVIKSLGIEYVCANPGSAFRGLHESVINYGGNKGPEFITCCHEESSVAMAHGYVGIQHAAMAIYNAYCDRVPVYIIAGNILDATKRISAAEWVHSVQDAAAMVRDYLKWDDLPLSLPHFAESAVRAYKIAMTPPMMPVLLIADGELQENPIPDDLSLRIPKLALAAPPQGDSGAVAEAARLLVAADNPVIIADRAARTPVGLTRLIELAETLQAPVIDQMWRMNFPSRHPLNQSQRSRELVCNADVVLGLECSDFWNALHSFRDQINRTSVPLTKPGVKLISITAADLFSKSNYQDFQRFPQVDLDIAADAEATLPSLTESIRGLLTSDRTSVLQDRGAQFAIARQESLQRARDAAAYAWDASPISTARLCAELWANIKNEDWSLVSTTTFVNRWPQRLWSFDKYHQYIGGHGGAGVGYGAPAAVGAALANRKYGRLSVNIQCDGDLMYAPGVLWTAAHHRIPLLSVMHNNRAYHQEVMHIQRMANRHQRGVTTAGIGTTIENPNIDYAGLARSLGVHGEGPVTDPKELGGALKRALEVVKRGEPALIDAYTQPR